MHASHAASHLQPPGIGPQLLPFGEHCCKLSLKVQHLTLVLPRLLRRHV